MSCSAADDLFSGSSRGGEKIKAERKHWPLPVRHYAPGYAPDPPEPLTCIQYERCKQCNYMAHGFQCDHGNGKCIFTDMEKINRREQVNVSGNTETQ